MNPTVAKSRKAGVTSKLALPPGDEMKGLRPLPQHALQFSPPNEQVRNSQVYSSFPSKGPVTRAALIRDTGLTVRSMKSALTQLEKANLVTQISKTPSVWQLGPPRVRAVRVRPDLPHHAPHPEARLPEGFEEEAAALLALPPKVAPPPASILAHRVREYLTEQKKNRANLKILREALNVKVKDLRVVIDSDPALSLEGTRVTFTPPKPPKPPKPPNVRNLAPMGTGASSEMSQAPSRVTQGGLRPGKLGILEELKEEDIAPPPEPSPADSASRVILHKLLRLPVVPSSEDALRRSVASYNKSAHFERGLGQAVNVMPLELLSTLISTVKTSNKPAYDRALSSFIQVPVIESLSVEELNQFSAILKKMGRISLKVAQSSVNPRMFTLINKLASANLNQSDIDDLLHGRSNAILATKLQYSGHNREIWTKLFGRKLLAVAVRHGDMSLAGVNLDDPQGVAYNLFTEIELISKACKGAARATNSHIFQDQAILGLVSERFLTQTFTEPGFYYPYRPTKLGGGVSEEERKSSKNQGDPNYGDKLVAANFFTNTSFATVSPFIVGVLVNQAPAPGFEIPNMLWRERLAEAARTKFFGTGGPVGIVYRLEKMSRLMDLRLASKTTVFDSDAVYDSYWEDTLGYLSDGTQSLGLYLPEPIQVPFNQWYGYLEGKDLRVTYPNFKSSAGFPYPLQFNKGDAFAANCELIDEIFYAVTQVDNDQDLLDMYPFIELVQGKSKAEVFPFATKFDLEKDGFDYDDWSADLEANPKGRKIFVSPYITEPLRLIISMANLNLKKAPLIDRLREPIFSLKGFKFVDGTYDLLVRRCCGLPPFEGAGDIMMHYSDNIDIFSRLSEEWVDPKFVQVSEVLGMTVEDLPTNKKGLVNIGGFFAKRSFDGEGFEAATDKKKMTRLLESLLKTIEAGPLLSSYCRRVVLKAIVDFKAIIGTHTFRLDISGSGHPLTFEANDFNARLLLQHIEPTFTSKKITKISHELGMSMVLERVTLLPKPGTHPVVTTRPLEWDILSNGVAYFDQYDDGNGLFVPVLLSNRLHNALFYEKKRRVGEAGRLALAAKHLQLYHYGTHVSQEDAYISQLVLNELRKSLPADPSAEELAEAVEETELPPAIVMNFLRNGLNQTDTVKLFGRRPVAKYETLSSFVPPPLTSWADATQYQPPNAKEVKGSVFHDKHTVMYHQRKLGEYIEKIGAPVVVTRVIMSMGKPDNIASFEFSDDQPQIAGYMKKYKLNEKKRSFLKMVLLKILFQNPKLASTYERDAQRFESGRKLEQRTGEAYLEKRKKYKTLEGESKKDKTSRPGKKARAALTPDEILEARQLKKDVKRIGKAKSRKKTKLELSEEKAKDKTPARRRARVEYGSKFIKIGEKELKPGGLKSNDDGSLARVLSTFEMKLAQYPPPSQFRGPKRHLQLGTLVANGSAALAGRVAQADYRNDSPEVFNAPGYDLNDLTTYPKLLAESLLDHSLLRVKHKGIWYAQTEHGYSVSDVVAAIP
jgi:hypothetical protein